MKKLKDQVPESLVGVFGIDFIGSIVRRVTIPMYVILFIVSAAVGYFGTDYFPASEITLGDDLVPFTWVPLIFSFYVGKLFSNLFERTVTSIKVVYFTVFYTKITHPERIADEMQEELLDYLKLDQMDEVDNLGEQAGAAPEPAPI